jgi:transcriptional regulator with PAS, ATPase and Fis domain
MKYNWINEFPAAITVCDKEGIILEMNEKSCKTFEKDGGRNLTGSNLYDCHPEPSKTALNELMQKQVTNAYTIEKNGIKKLIYQSPWYDNGQFMGLVEISMEIPFEMPHFVRKGS